MCAPVKAQRIPVLTGNVGWLAIPAGVVGGPWLLAQAFGWTALVLPALTAVCITALVIAVTYRLMARGKAPRPSPSRGESVPSRGDQVTVSAWIDGLDVWPSDEQARITAERRAQVAAEHSL